MKQTIKNLRNNEGFTLVELLIVIVVIAILAAITIVAYNGVQNKAHTTAANSAASEVIKKAALYQTSYNAYPASLSILQTEDTTADPEFTKNSPAYLSSSDVTALTTAPSSTAVPDKDNSVFYEVCTGGNGARATYWDYSAKNAESLTTGDCSS